MPEYTHDHVHLRASDSLQAAEFYEKAFNAKRTSIGKAGTGMAVELHIGVTRLIIHPPRDASQSAADVPEKRLGLEHFGLRTDDIEAAVADLKTKGVEFMGDIRTAATGNRFAFLMAPDNVMIELVQLRRREPRP